MTLGIHSFVMKPRNLTLPVLANKLFKLVKSEGYNAANVAEETEDLNEADIVSSRIRGDYDLHTPVLDIDIPAMLVPSTTPGKHHLYVDAPMPWEAYVRLLDAMADAGILEEGYVSASKARGFTAVRLPWVRKG